MPNLHTAAVATLFCALAGCTSPGPPPPPDGLIDGSPYAFYGKDQGGWLNLRNQFDMTELYGRRGQRQFLQILDGYPEQAIASAREQLASHPDDAEAHYIIAVAQCRLGDGAAAARSMIEGLARGLPFTRFLAGPRELLEPLRETEEFRRLAAGHGLVHGPLLGSLTATSARFWVRTIAETPVQVRVSDSIESATVLTSSQADYTAVVEITGLDPDTEHQYDVRLAGESVHSGSFRTFPQRGAGTRARIVFGGGAKYTPENERMWDTIGANDPAALLLLGDNVYIDLPERFGPFHRYTYYRRQSQPSFRELVQTVPVYAIWDDHDAAIGDSWLGPFVDRPPWKMSMLDGFRMNWNNPAYGSEDWPSTRHRFSIGDIDFFLLDGRFYRTNPYGENPSMLGPDQKAWLLDGLERSTATFKVIASPVPWSFETKEESRDTWNGFRTERTEIFRFLKERRIDGVVLISADRHRSDARRIDRDDAYAIYEFESSRLTNDKAHALKPGALFGYNEKPSFGLLSFDTTKPDPALTYTIVSIDNEPVHSLTLTRSELGHTSTR